MGRWRKLCNNEVALLDRLIDMEDQDCVRLFTIVELTKHTACVHFTGCREAISYDRDVFQEFINNRCLVKWNGI